MTFKSQDERNNAEDAWDIFIRVNMKICSIQKLDLFCGNFGLISLEITKKSGIFDCAISP